jgi:TrmH family RNA methyltransferase
MNLNELKETGLPLISTALDGENLATFKWPKSYIVCLGNEGKGITDELKTLSTYNVFIESFDNKGAESLNAASSASIILYQARINNN